MQSLNPSNPTFHEIFRQNRNDLHLTQSELAHALGISTVMVQRYEMDSSKKHSARPNPNTMKKIEAFFSKTTEISNKRLLQDTDLEDLLAELKARGFQVQLNSIL